MIQSVICYTMHFHTTRQWTPYQGFTVIVSFQFVVSKVILEHRFNTYAYHCSMTKSDLIVSNIALSVSNSPLCGLLVCAFLVVKCPFEDCLPCHLTFRHRWLQPAYCSHSCPHPINILTNILPRSSSFYKHLFNYPLLFLLATNTWHFLGPCWHTSIVQLTSFSVCRVTTSSAPPPGPRLAAMARTTLEATSRPVVAGNLWRTDLLLGSHWISSWRLGHSQYMLLLGV